MPLGVDALQSLEPYAIRGFVGAFLVGYGAWDLWRDKETSGEAGVDEASAGALAEAVPYGVAAGFLGGAIAEPGPVAVVLSNKRRWSPPTTRAMLVRFFIPARRPSGRQKRARFDSSPRNVPRRGRRGAAGRLL